MKTQFKLAVLALVLSSLVSPLSTAFAQGSLTPPGAPAPTMKSLGQVEPRTPISSVPYTISAPGSYYLTANLNTTASNAIVIKASGVTLDLSGFNISSTVASAANGGTAILLSGNSLSDITICNGHIQSGVITNGDGTYSGPGFGFGIYYDTAEPVNTRVSNLSVKGCLYVGIALGTDNSTMVDACVVRIAGSEGIVASSVKNCIAAECGEGIRGDQISDCRGEATGLGYGIFARVFAVNCYGYSVNEIGVFSYTFAQNCYGYSSSGTGISAINANNCYGWCDGNSYGILAAIAQNCFGFSGSGTALKAENASFCTGYNASGLNAIQATIATGCISDSGPNLITYKYNMP